MLKHSTILCLLLLAGCATPQSLPDWVAGEKVDQFTDARSCRVERRAGAVSILARTQMAYYPFIERRGPELRVGLISGGAFKMPVGVVQLRVDTHAAWTIDPAETPVDTSDVMTEAMRKSMAASMPVGADEKAQAAYQRSIETLGATMSKTLSPFTVATGEKARAILDQMRRGDTLIYQTLGINQAASTTGRAKLGPDFMAALAKCGL